MIRKIFILSLMYILNVFITFGAPIDSRTAWIIAQNYMDYCRPTTINSIKSVATRQQGDITTIYYFSFENGGWVIVSGDDSTEPILGYSLKGNIPDSKDENAEAFEYLMNGYSEQIIETRTKKVKNIQSQKIWDNILSRKLTSPQIQHKSYTQGKPLLNTSRGEVAWGQGTNNDGSCTNNERHNASYNMHCPPCDLGNCSCEYAFVGCVAVAMGQIMWYWQWPNRANIPVTDNSSMLTGRAYDWSLMPNKISKSTPFEQANEIARLLRHCGLASYMSYHNDGSSSDSNKAEAAFKNNFFYNSATKVKRSDYTDDGWTKLIRAEIDAERPVYYSGDKGTFEGGHAFICDGYSAHDPNLFHFNFGWRGSSNGYFRLNNVNPLEYSYNTRQDAIIGISPSYMSIVPNHVTDTDIQNYVDNTFNHIQAIETINVPATGKQLVVESGGRLLMTAGNSISLKSGFHVKQGGGFKTSIRKGTGSEQCGINLIKASNALTPDGDGIHDELCCAVENVNSFEFTLFNLSGKVIYENSGLVHGNEACVWDGSGIRDQVCGGNWCTYYAALIFRNNCGEQIIKRYNVSIPAVLMKSTMAPKITLVEIDGFDFIPDGLTDESTSIANDPDVKIYPNPSNNKLEIELTINLPSHISIGIYTLDGKLVHQLLSNKEYPVERINESFDVGTLQTGMYLLEVQAGNKKITRKIVKQ